jgi:hypothetical protein
MAGRRRHLLTASLLVQRHVAFLLLKLMYLAPRFVRETFVWQEGR